MNAFRNASAYISSPRNFGDHYQTIPDRLRYLARKLGDKEVYVFLNTVNNQRESVTARELLERSEKIAYGLAELGIKKGDIVAACLPNCLDGLLCMLGIICAGGISLNPVMNRLDGSDIVNIMNKGKAICLIVKSGASGAELKACRQLIEYISDDGKAVSKSIPSLKYFVSLDATDWGCLLMENLLKGNNNGQHLPNMCPNDTMVIFPTSGSTGRSKLVPHSHFGAMITGHHLQESMVFNEYDVIYTERRMAWIGGFPYMYLHNGVKTVIKTATSYSSTEHCKLTYDVLKREKCTMACMLPSTIVGLVDVAKHSELMLQNIHTGGLPIADVCMKAIGQITKVVTNCYGSSEAAFLTSFHVTCKDVYVNYCAGFPHAGVEIKILNKDGVLAKRNEDGQVFVRSPALFKSYYNDECQTRDDLNLSGWFDTDDIGYIDEFGRLVIHGRQSDLILQNGKLLSPAAIESLVKSHPDVLDVLVVAIPDDAKFELACACVIGKEGRSVTSDDVRIFYERKLIATMDDNVRKFSPEQFIIFDDFPRLYTGKPDKRKLKEMLEKYVREGVSLPFKETGTQSQIKEKPKTAVL